MKRAFLEVSLDDLAETLGLPDGIELHSVESRSGRGTIKLHLRGDNLPDQCDVDDRAPAVRLESLSDES